MSLLRPLDPSYVPDTKLTKKSQYQQDYLTVTTLFFNLFNDARASSGPILDTGTDMGSIFVFMGYSWLGNWIVEL